MIIDKDILEYVVAADENIRVGLTKINANEDGIIFATSPSGALEGVLTDGDFRRWVLGVSAVDLDLPVGTIVNRQFKFAYVTDGEERIRNLLSNQIKFVPLLDAQGRLVAIAHGRKDTFRLGDRRVGGDAPVFVIAEIGNNHNGSLDLAKRLVDEAVATGADCAKFQMRHMASLYRNSGDANDAREDLGSQYTLDLLAKNQLKPDEMFAIFDYCKDAGILPLCTPWDPASLEVLEEYGLPGYKVASADITNHDFLELLARAGKPLICSTGMSTEPEIIDAVTLLKRRCAKFALLHCNSTYPAPFKDLNLRYITKLREIGGCPVGYSSHDRGINAVVAAVSLGARIVEKHFTLDRDMEGVDHKVSLLPGEFRDMVTAIREVDSALGTGSERRLSQGEVMNRESLGKSLVINCDLAVGQTIRAEMIEVKSPGQGLPPYMKKEVVGKVARRPFKRGDSFFRSDLSDAKIESRTYRLGRPFGIPIRYHDVRDLAGRSNFDFLEFHMSYKDLDEDPARFLDGPLAMDLVVHAPELFAGDHILDLCSLDPAYRRRSVSELTRVVGITRRLKTFFTKSTTPCIIVNAGGFTQDAPLEPVKRRDRYALIRDSLAQIDLGGVEIIPQTMPPFPWHFGGQRYQNLFMDPHETALYCKESRARICLDISHSKLACNHHKWSFTEFLELVGPYVAHLHIADAAGVDGEGLQVGEGDVDFRAMAQTLKHVAPRASFIPEIWQGHKNGGEGFWVALERLEGVL